MKPVIEEHAHTYYVSDLIKFISDNSDMEWNYVCDYVRDNGIVSDCNEAIYYDREDIFGYDSNGMNEEAIKWVRDFFTAHPFINKMMVDYN